MDSSHFPQLRLLKFCDYWQHLRLFSYDATQYMCRVTVFSPPCAARLQVPSFGRISNNYFIPKMVLLLFWSK